MILAFPEFLVLLFWT